jgi:ATP/maltotriose-dependent transcriptional regulator MalT
VLLPEGRGFLTRRQVEILRLMANGYSGRETGRLLGIGSETVKFHKVDLQRARRGQRAARGRLRAAAGDHRVNGLDAHITSGR